MTRRSVNPKMSSEFWRIELFSCAAADCRQAQIMTMLCRSLSGIEFELHLAQAPHLYVVRKQWRETAQLAHPLTYYYILDGSIYQAPTVQAILASRLVRKCCLSAQHARQAKT